MKGKRVHHEALIAGMREFLRREHHLILGFCRREDRFFHKFFKEDVQDLALFNPFFSVNGALYARRIFSSEFRLLLILRPCEVRAFVELTKFAQVNRDAFITVSVDCFGTFSSRLTLPVPEDLLQLKSHMMGNENLRWACKVCTYKSGLFGDCGLRMDTSANIWMIPLTDKGEELWSLFPSQIEEVPKEFASPLESTYVPFQTDLQTLERDLEPCTLCMNCRDMCPLCFCLDCLFNGEEYLPRGDGLLNRVVRKGGEAMPSGKLLYHLVRMYHVSQSCVGCGTCEEACPQGIPLTKYLKGISERIQHLFSYLPGRSFGDSLPFTTFKEDELTDVED